MLVKFGDDYVRRDPENAAMIFYGCFAGLNILRSIGNALITKSAPAEVEPPGAQLLEAFEAQTSAEVRQLQDGPYAVLPTLEQARALVEQAGRTALACHDIMDWSLFSQQLVQIYETDPEAYLPTFREPLSLLYALMALGRRYKTPTVSPDETGIGTNQDLKG